MAKLTWHQVCSKLTSMTEQEIVALLDEEIKEHKRPAFVRRLHQRFSTLRAARERAAIMEGLGK
jgi:hypothetical protein